MLSPEATTVGQLEHCLSMTSQGKKVIYCVTVNFGEVFNLAILQKITIIFHALSRCADMLATAKFKICPCILMTGSPNFNAH